MPRAAPVSDPTPIHPPQRRAPAGARSEQRVRDILRTGRAVFAECGYEHTTTGEIARRLGVSEATVFTYFSTKRELCQRVISDWYAEITAALAEGLPREKPLLEQFRWFVRTHMELFLVEGTGLCAFVLSEGRGKSHGGHGDLGEVLVELQRRYTAPLMDLLARGRASGELRDDVSLSLMRGLVLGPVEHLLWELVSAGKVVDVTAAAHDLVALVWPVLCKPGEELRRLRALRDQLGQALASS
ncbi:TetR/AcrR family transcriptional regulator [Burkholderiaceae bacterium UC74_6]